MTAWWMMVALAGAAEPGAAQDKRSTEAVPEAAAAPVAPVTGPERSSPPAVVPADWIPLDEPTVVDLGNGRTGWYVRVPGVRKVGVSVVLHKGTYDLDQWPTELARGALNFADLATVDHDAETLSILRDVNDLDLSSWIDHHEGGVQLMVAPEELDLGLELLGDVLREPTYPKKEIKQQLRDQRLYYTTSGPSSLRAVSWSALDFAWAPADHAYGARPDLKEMKKLPYKGLMQRLETWRQAGPVTALVVGDVPWEQVEPGLKAALEGVGAPGERSPELELPAPSETRVVAVDMPGQAQSAIRLRYAAPARSADDRVSFYATNWALGGHFLSRLNANLREDKGFTYGSGSSFRPGERQGSVTVYVDVKVENTAAAVREIEKEVARLVAEGVTAEEIDMARQATVSDWNGTRETAGSARRFYDALASDGETTAIVRARGEQLEALTPEATKAAAATWFSDRPHLWVIVGDRAALEPQLKDLGWDAEWISPSDAILGQF